MQQTNRNKCIPTKQVPSSTHLPDVQYDDFAKIAKALGHPIRLRIISILKNTNGCICGKLVDQLPISQATVSQHLKVLKNAKIIRGSISGPSMCYCLEPKTLENFKQLFTII